MSDLIELLFVVALLYLASGLVIFVLAHVAYFK